MKLKECIRASVYYFSSFWCVDGVVGFVATPFDSGYKAKDPGSHSGSDDGGSLGAHGAAGAAGRDVPLLCVAVRE